MPQGPVLVPISGNVPGGFVPAGYTEQGKQRQDIR